jgi:hypothetical protein
VLWKNSILPLFKTFDLFVLIIAELEKHLTQEDTGKLTLEAWNKLQKKLVQPLSQKDQP